MRLRAVHECKNVVLGFVEQRGKFGELRPELVGDARHCCRAASDNSKLLRKYAQPATD